MSTTTEGPRTRRRNRLLKRTYVACIPCRTRKVKCIIDSEPPCAKCQREHRECRFDIHEKSRKHRESPKWATKHVAESPAASESALPGPPGHEQQQQPLPPFVSPLSHVTTSPAILHNESPSSVQAPVAIHQTRTSEPAQDDTRHGQPAMATASPCFTERVVSSIVTVPSDALAILFDAANAIHTDSLYDPSPHPPYPQLDFASNTIPVVSQLSCPQEEILDLWDKCRFVRQGWFTSQEAVTYVDLFYQHFAPLSPAVPELYRESSNHYALICEEPMLCCTILMISSRYFILPGAGGQSRGQFIHHRLWQYCELLIRRVTLGQEKYSTAKTRALGTIESLLLISDWHPRSIHFPPETEGWDGLLISPAYDRRNRVQRNGTAPLSRWREDVFEPSKRAERMSWMLLGCAVNLAYELGVFAGDSSKSMPDQVDEQSRSLRLRKLLYIHVTQMGNRLGCGSILPENLCSATSLTSPASSSSNGWDLHTDLSISLARLTKTASTMFFTSSEYTRQTVLNGQYGILLEHFSSSLGKWWDTFATRYENLPDAASDFLAIEYYYLKAYTNALSIQAIVEQGLSRGISTIIDCQNGSLKDCFRANDVTFIQEVQSACQKILELAVELASKGILRYAPSRVTTYITCSSVLLLKAAFVCRAACVHGDGSGELQSLERAIVAFRSSSIDDMDLSCRYATLIEQYLAKLQTWVVADGGSQHRETSSNTNTAHSEDQLPSRQALNYTVLDQDTSGSGLNGVAHHSATNDGWWALPFDPSLAPFTSSEHPPFTLGFQADSLDFLWNLTDIGIGA